MQELNKLILFFTMAVLISCGESSVETETTPLAHSHDLHFLQAAVEKYPDSLLLGQELIQSYRNNGNYDSAKVLTLRLIEKDTGNAYLWNIMATLNYELGDTDGTINSLKKAIVIFPLPDYYIALGTVYAETKNKTALAIADVLLSQPEPNPNRDDAYFIKGLYYNYTSQSLKAIAVLDSAIALNFTYMYAYREKSIALYDLKMYRDAVNVLKRAVTLQNSYDEGYYWLGKNYEKLNKTDSAVQSYQNALLYDKNYTEAGEALNRLTRQNK